MPEKEKPDVLHSFENIEKMRDFFGRVQESMRLLPSLIDAHNKVAMSLNAIVKLLSNKGVLTRDEFQVALKASMEEMAKEMAEGMEESEDAEIKETADDCSSE